MQVLNSLNFVWFSLKYALNSGRGHSIIVFFLEGKGNPPIKREDSEINVNLGELCHFRFIETKTISPQPNMYLGIILQNMAIN